MSSEIYQIRLQKLQEWEKLQGVVYPGQFSKSHTATQARGAEDGAEVAIAGRIMFIRDMGKLCFGHLRDESGKVQFSLDANTLAPELHRTLMRLLDLGDTVGIKGETWTTKKGEKTVRVREVKLLAKSLRPLPAKWHGLEDAEMKARQRYLDLLANEDSWTRFQKRLSVISIIRRRLTGDGFIEVETPILTAASSGASARPFITHHNALDIPLYLRISPETYLKRLMVGGYEKVFELGKSFRNEGIDASHLQEFTMLEWYAAFWDYRDNMRYIQQLLQEIVAAINEGSLKLSYQGQELDFSGDWPQVTYRDLILQDTGVDLDKAATVEELKALIAGAGLGMDTSEFVGLGGLVDALYKRYSRPKLIQPMFLLGHPESVVPLARRSDEDGRYLDMFQVLVNSWEIVKAYSELVNPVEQRARLEEQTSLRAAGDDEAMMLEEDFILAMEYGMPPMSGLGLGIDRLVALLTDAKNIRDVIYFPSMRPEATPALADEEPAPTEPK